jgi:hypothetical protein
MRTSTPAGGTRPSGHASGPWTASPAATTSGGCSPAPTSPCAARAIWIVGAHLSTALRRVEDHALPLESARAQVAYGQPSAINRLLILNAEPHPGRGTVLLLREAIGF